MDYLFAVSIILASIYTFTFARWLSKSGNKGGACGMYFLIFGSIAIAVFRIFLN